MFCKNGDRGTKPANKFMVITPLLVIELTTSTNGNPTNLFLSVLSNSTPPVDLYNTP